MIRQLRWFVLPALLLAALVLLTSNSVQATEGPASGPAIRFDVADSYPSYPLVGSYVDHYGHAAAWAWESGSAAPATWSDGTHYRQGLWRRSWGYRR